MVVISDVRRAHAFVAVVYKKNIYDKKRFNVIVKECELAKAVGKPMYAVVEKGADLGVLGGMPWKKMVRFNNDFEIPGIINFIDGDIKAGGYYT